MSREILPQYSGSASKGSVIRDPSLGILFAYGTTVPTDATAGYAPGCLFLDVDALTTSVLWRNEGTLASCAFKRTLSLVDVGNIDLSTLVATAAELNRNNQASTREVSAAGANLTVTQALHDGKTIKLDQATGTAVTLPAMTGSGSRYRFVCSVATSGGSQVITATGAHLFGSIAIGDDTGVGTLFTNRLATSAGGSTIITLDGSTKGGRKGDWLEIEDVATSIGIVRGQLNASGTEATPFS